MAKKPTPLGVYVSPTGKRMPAYTPADEVQYQYMGWTRYVGETYETPADVAAGEDGDSTSKPAKKTASKAAEK